MILQTFLIFIIIFGFNFAYAQTGEYGTLSGQVRAYHIFGGAYIKAGKDYDVSGSTIGGHIRYTTPKFNNFGVSSSFYYATSTGLTEKDNPNTIIGAGRFLEDDLKPRGLIPEINIFYDDGEHKIVAGRQKFSSPMTKEVVTYLPTMFEALTYTNKTFSDTTLVFSQIDKMAFGSRAPVEFGLIGEATRTAGASQNGLALRGRFRPIETLTVNDKSVNTKGLTVFAIKNRSLPNTTLEFWDYYGHDILNMTYIEASYKIPVKEATYIASIQYLHQNSVGKDLANAFMDDGSSNLYGVKLSAKYGKSLAFIAYNHTGSSKIFNPWGGDPAYTSTFFSRNEYRADVDAFKVGYNYKIKKDLTLITDFANYGKSNTMGSFVAAGDKVPAKAIYNAIETTALLVYKPIKNLTILSGVIYKNSEYAFNGKKIRLLDVDLVITYNF